jgi:hypothetical protein
MSLFDELQSDWRKQTPGPSPSEGGGAEIRTKVARLRAGSLLTIAILTLTLLIIGIFFYYVGAMSTPGYGLPVTLMLGALFFRILAEILGRFHIRRISPGLGAADYRAALSTYHKARLWIHYLLTPMALIAYVWGFVLLTPTFREQLSEGFYTYILVSGGAVLVGILWLIVYSIRKEADLLDSLREEE